MSTPETRFQCRHIFTSGQRCGSPSLKNEEFCYHHHSTRKAIARADLETRRGRRSSFALPEPEDRTAIQLSIGEVLRRLASNDLDPKRAGLLLYGLQIASINLPKAISETLPVEEVTLDETHGPIAPVAEFHNTKERPSLLEILTRQWEQDAHEAATAAEAEASQTIDLDATAQSRSAVPETSSVLPAHSSAKRGTAQTRPTVPAYLHVTDKESTLLRDAISCADLGGTPCELKQGCYPWLRRTQIVCSTLCPSTTVPRCSPAWKKLPSPYPRSSAVPMKPHASLTSLHQASPPSSPSCRMALA